MMNWHVFYFFLTEFVFASLKKMSLCDYLTKNEAFKNKY